MAQPTSRYAKSGDVHVAYQAIRCAGAIQDALRKIDVPVRAGVHTGEVEMTDDDVRGIAVHIASRVAGLGKANDVVVSRTVKDLVAGSGIVFEDLGAHQLKGIPDEWQLFRVGVERPG